MDFIQCPHCSHKYGVNDRMRTAVGKQIRCKQCQIPFRIVILNLSGRIPESVPTTQQESSDNQQKTKGLADDARQSESNCNDSDTADLKATHPNDLKPEATRSPEVAADAVDDTSDQTQIPDQPAKKTSVNLKRKINTGFLGKLTVTIVLSCTAIGLFIYLQYPQWLDLTSNLEQIAHPEPLLKPLHIAPVGPVAADKKPLSDDAGRNKTLLEGPDQPVQVCRDAAADFWMRIHLMSTALLSNET